MPRNQTGAERYLTERLDDPEYARAHRDATERIHRIDAVIRSLDSQRTALGLSKAELARRVGVRPEAVRRLFSAESPNPTLTTLVAIAQVLDLDVAVSPAKAATRGQSVARGTHRRTA